MYYPRKLKADRDIAGLIPAIIALAILAVFSILYGFKIGAAALSIFLLLYSLFSLLAYYRTRNHVYSLGFLYQVLAALLISTSEFGMFPLNDEKYYKLLSIIVLALIIMLIYLMATRKAKWKGREVLELAARSIEPLPDGFTERPKPAGTARYTRDELMGFAEYLQRNLVAMPYLEDNRIVFVPAKMGDEFRYVMSPQRFRLEKTWIAFDFSGNVTVMISKKDYLQYKEELSFDQLCENMGSVFIRFLEYFKKGEEDRIIFSLNELKLSIFE